jgi:hypothetical protein
MNNPKMSLEQFMARHELLSSSAAPRPLTDDEVRERTKFLKAENARLKALLERQYRESAEELMRQMRLKGNKNYG